MTCFIPDTPNETSNEAFRRYLEKSGVVDAITSALVMLFSLEEKPEDPLDFLRRNMGDERPEVEEYEAALKELETAKDDVAKLKKQITKLRNRLAKYEGEEAMDEEDEENGCD